jgi:hypothetical protein
VTVAEVVAVAVAADIFMFPGIVDVVDGVEVVLLVMLFVVVLVLFLVFCFIADESISVWTVRSTTLVDVVLVVAALVELCDTDFEVSSDGGTDDVVLLTTFAVGSVFGTMDESIGRFRVEVLVLVLSTIASAIPVLFPVALVLVLVVLRAVVVGVVLVADIVGAKLLNICVNRLGLDAAVVEVLNVAVVAVVKEASNDEAVEVAGFGGLCNDGADVVIVVPNNSCISCGVKCGLLCIANAMAMAIFISSSS